MLGGSCSYATLCQEQQAQHKRGDVAFAEDAMDTSAGACESAQPGDLMVQLGQLPSGNSLSVPPTVSSQAWHICFMGRERESRAKIWILK